MEIWKPVKGYEGKYEISNYGRVKSLSRKITHKNGKSYMVKERIMKPIMVGNYRGVQLCNGLGSKKHYVHRLVASHFIGEPTEEANTVNHKDGDKYNNHYENLEWMSYGDNIKHAYRTGLNPSVGENNGHAKFTDDLVIEMRNLYESGKYKQSELANMFGVSKMQTHRIVKYKLRKIVKGKVVNQ